MRRRVSQVVAAGTIVLLVYVSWRQAVLTGRSARDHVVGAGVAPIGAASFAVRYPSVPFVTACLPSMVSNDDPIGHPGDVGASHEHQFFGSRVVSAVASLADLQKGGTSCTDDADHASYWLPTVREARWTELRASYSAGPLDAAAIGAYPSGLQMVSGQDPTAVAWSCDRGMDDGGWTPTPPACARSTPLAVRIDFPQCWDGVGHVPESMARPVGSVCPPSHPHALPWLRLRAELSGSPTDVVLSSGSLPTMHADFWNAWEPTRLRELVAVCVRGERRTNAERERCDTSAPADGHR
jgi:hypothetical protein